MRSSLAITFSLLGLAVGGVCGTDAPRDIVQGSECSMPDFTVKLETVMKHDDGQFLWFHLRATVIPARSKATPAVVMRIQKHLKISDYDELGLDHYEGRS